MVGVDYFVRNYLQISLETEHSNVPNESRIIGDNGNYVIFMKVIES